MKRNTWQIQTAKNCISEVINNAIEGEPQLITRHGEPVAYLISVQTFDRKIRKGNLKKELLLNRPHKDLNLNISRDNDPGRDINL